MIRELRSSVSLFIVFFALTGFGYPLLMLLLGHSLFPYQANGSLIEENDKIIGSQLIGQNFTNDAYFHSRPSAAGNGYDAGSSSGSNLGPTNSALMKAITDRAAELKKTTSGNVPVDIVTTSGSGLDPDISPDAAHFQIARVAAARQLSPMQIEDLIKESITSRSLGFLGENRVNVLNLNRALDKLTPAPTPIPKL